MFRTPISVRLGLSQVNSNLFQENLVSLKVLLSQNKLSFQLRASVATHSRSSGLGANAFLKQNPKTDITLTDIVRQDYYRSQVYNYICSSNISPNQSENHQRGLIVTAKRWVQVKRKIHKKQITPLNTKYNMEWPKILFFGDSITRRANDVDEGCWGSMIESRVNNYFDVDYRGFEGYNTRWALDMMPTLFPKAYLDKVEIVVPFYGHNDSWEPRNPLHVPVDEYERNFREIIKYFQNNGVDKSKIIMITPTWFHLEAFVKFLESIGMPPSGKSFEDAKKYAEVVTRIAKDNDIELLDMFKISSEFEPLSDLFSDGVHYSKKGAQVLFDNLFPIIKRKIETNFKKPLENLHHAVPWDQRPEVLSALSELVKKA